MGYEIKAGSVTWEYAIEMCKSVELINPHINKDGNVMAFTKEGGRLNLAQVLINLYTLKSLSFAEEIREITPEDIQLILDGFYKIA